MKNQPNEMVTLEWLLPLFEQQLSTISDGWQADTDYNIESIKQGYHEISNILIMVNLPKLATLAARLSTLANTDNTQALDDDQRRVGQFAHQLLHHELNQYAQTGSYHCALVDKAINELTQILPEAVTLSDSNLAITSTARLNSESTQTIDVSIPDTSSFNTLSSTPLELAQYRQLLLVWRQQVQRLLAANSNQPAILAVLEKVSRYLWQTTNTYQANYSDAQQRLWYLAALWLDNLAHNSLPKPSSYAPLLAQLDQVLNRCYQQALNIDNPLAAPTDEDMEDLIAEIYIQISRLAVVSEQTQEMLDYFSQATESNLRFLPRVLAKLESIMSDLDKPQTLIKPLKQLKTELARRGWVDYMAQAKQILTDLVSSTTSESGFDQTKKSNRTSTPTALQRYSRD